MRMHVGTSGYSYPEWKGSFYPEKLPAKAMLGYYAERFQTVEINNTFYRMPTEAMLKGWGDQVPEGFAFALKASRRITHDRRLQDVGEATAFLFQAGAVLGQKLGPFLFQLPPFLKKDLATLKTFLALLPPGARAALEFRHATWLDDEVYEALRAAGAALCVADAGEPVDAPLLATADWGYLRLRRPDYGSDDLKSWAERIQTQPWQDCFVYFKHEEEGKGPQLATEFMKWIG